MNGLNRYWFLWKGQVAGWAQVLTGFLIVALGFLRLPSNFAMAMVYFVFGGSSAYGTILLLAEDTLERVREETG